MKISMLAPLLTFLATISTSLAQDNPLQSPLEIAEPSKFAVFAEAGKPRQDVIQSPGSEFITVHFARFDLPDGDSLVVRSPDSKTSYTYTKLGRGDLGLSNEGFYSTPIPGDAVVVEYRVGASNTTGGGAAKGYVIDEYLKSIDNSVQSVCGADDTRPAKCYLNGDGDGAADPKHAYAKAKAVLRLHIDGRFLCTGWLVGSEGHLLTNNHCVKAAANAKRIDVEAMAESNTCQDECQVSLGCRGKLIATTTQFVTTNQKLDYTLLKLPAGTDVSPYGYLQLRATGPVERERIYIPQHPHGYAKRIATVDDDGVPSQITAVSKSGPCGDQQVAYMTDTDHGASGSPVISAIDDTVIALHHCGGCDNTAINSAQIVDDWKALGITIQNAVV